MTLGQKLKAARRKKHLTQLGLAKKAGVSEGSIWWYECDKVDPSFFTVCCLAQALGITLNYLAGWEETEGEK